MHKALKQGVTAVIQFGPFVDKADGVTLITNLVGTGANQLENTSTGILISKNGGTLAARHATATASAYDAYGCYKVTLDGTDTGTPGSLRVVFSSAGVCLPVWDDFIVVPANVYEALVAGTEWLETTGLRADFAINGDQLTVDKKDGSTAQYTKTIASNANAIPIIGLS